MQKSPFRLIKKDIEFDPSIKVIKKNDYLISLEAEELISHAKKLGEVLILEAHGEADGIRKKAYDEGKKEAEKEVVQTIFTVKNQISQNLKKAEASMAEMVEVCVRKLLGEFSQEQLLILLVRKSLEAVEADNKVKLWVHPHAIDAFEEALDFFEKNRAFSQIDVSIDDAMAEDTCLIEYNVGFMVIHAKEQVETVIGIMRSNFSA